ncbi:Eukaryotic translation initiation factor 2 subunit 2 [Heterocephalus glaber]|uniref:Eukaryotic translation initiation factor 2 subunit 2 n=1 Tax=Heterocephalus glaber TaxID=10181 RepID=G5B574_HETGA|nr:Eukaryotic translation initiation factor 2 subunit 2 [Heterocephalus glaber]
MSGDEMIFDPTMSKKKKKKKKPFMLDEEGDAQIEETQPSETKELEPEPTEDKDVEADEEDRLQLLKHHPCASSKSYTAEQAEDRGDENKVGNRSHGNR